MGDTMDARSAVAPMLAPVPTVAGGGGHTELKADAADAAAKEEQERIAERQRKEEKDGKDAATAAEAGAAVLRLMRAYYASKRALDADTANPTARESVTQADRALLQAGNALLAWIRGNESSRIGDNDHVVLEHARMFIAHRFESDKDVTKAVGDLLFLYRTAEALMKRTRGSANEEKWMWVFNGTAFDIKGIENMQKRPVEPGGEDGKEEKRTDAPPTDALPTTPGTTGTGAGANEAFTGNGQPRALVDAPDATLVEPAHVAAADNTHLADESGTGLPGGGGRGDSDRVDVSPKAIEDFIRRVVGGIDVPVANQWVPGPDPEATGPARDALSPKASQGDGTSEDGSRVSFNTADGKGGEGGAAVPPATHNEDDESHRDGEDLVSVAESAEGPSDAPRIAALDASEHGTPRSASGALHVQVTDGRALSPAQSPSVVEDAPDEAASDPLSVLLDWTKGVNSWRFDASASQKFHSVLDSAENRFYMDKDMDVLSANIHALGKEIDRKWRTVDRQTEEDLVCMRGKITTLRRVLQDRERRTVHLQTEEDLDFMRRKITRILRVVQDREKQSDDGGAAHEEQWELGCAAPLRTGVGHVVGGVPDVGDLSDTDADALTAPTQAGQPRAWRNDASRESVEGPSDAPRITALDASEHGTPRSASGALHVQVTDGRALSPGIPDQMQTMEDLYFAYVASSQRVGAHGNDEDAEEQLVAAGNAMLDWIQLHAFAEFTDSACVFSDEVCKFVNRQYRINHDARRAAECIDNLSIAMDNMPDPATDDLGDALRDVRILMEDVRRTVQQTEQERQRAVDDHAADADDADDAGDADVGDAHAALGALPVRVTSNSEDAIRKTASLCGAWLEARKRLDERVALGEPSEGADGDAQAAGENLCAWAKHGLVEYDDTAVTCLQTALNAVIVWLGATRDVDTALRWSVWVLFGLTRMFHPMGARRPYGLLAAQEMICRSVVDAQTALDTSPGGVLAAEGAGEAEFAQKTDAGMNTSYATGVCWWLREKWWEAESRDDTVLAGVERTGAGVLMLEWIECENLIDYDDAADALFTHVLEYIHWRSAEPRLDVVNLRCVRDALDNIIGPSDVSLKRQRETRLAAVVARLEQAQENAGVAVRADARDAVRDRTDARSEDDQRSKGGDADASGDEIKVLAAGTGASSTGNPVDRGSALCTRWYAAVNAPDQSGVAQAGDELLIWIAHSGLVEYDEDAQAFLEAALDVVIRRVSVDRDLERALSGLMRIQLARNSLRGMSADGEPGRLVALKWMIGNGLYDGNRFQIDATPNGVREADFAGQADLDNVRTAGFNTMYARQVSHLLVMKWLDAQQSLAEMVGAGTMMIEWIACHDLIVYDADAARIVAAALEFIGKQKKLGEADRTTADLNCVLGALLLIVDFRDETQRDACDAMVARVRLLLGHVQGGRSPLRKHSEDELAMENITRRAEADAVAHAEREATAEEEARVAAEADAAKKA